MVRWLTGSKRLSGEQERVLTRAESQGVPFAVSAATLVELAVLSLDSRSRCEVPLGKLLPALEPGHGFQIIPIDLDISREIAAIGNVLKDPADRTIVATARWHRLRLVTSDQRIIESNLVPVVD